MEDLPMCRICLCANTKMHNLVGTYLQKMFEDLTSMQLLTEDNRSTTVCYICNARLKSCYQMKMRCLQSEKLFTQALARNVFVPDIQDDMISINGLQITPVLHLSIGKEDSVLHCAEKEIKKEIPEVEVIVKREDSDDPQDRMDESLQEYFITREDNILPMDSDDLFTFNTEPVKEELEESPYAIDILEENFESIKNITRVENKVGRYKNIENNMHGDKRHHCKICYKNYTSYNNLQRHIRTHITNKYTCHICNKKFTSNNHLNRHIRVHSGEKPHECVICKKKYSEKTSLDRHICLKHTKNLILNNTFGGVLKIYTCDICEKEFDLKSKIQNHLRIHAGEKPYKCNLCKSAFTEKSTLNKHALTHSDNKPFQCDTCDKRFKRKGHLVTHIRSHSGDRPYKCNVCKKAFFQKGHLSEHIRVHTGVKPFICEFCDYNFSHKNSLSRHMMRAHDVRSVKVKKLQAD